MAAEDTTYSEQQNEAFCGIHALNMLFQERKVVWFPGCPIHLERDVLCALDETYETWIEERELQDHAMAEYILINNEIAKPVAGISASEKRLMEAAFRRAKLDEQKSTKLMRNTDTIEEDIKAAAFALDADEDTIEAWNETNAESLEMDEERVEIATAELESAEENPASALNAYAVEVAKRNLWWATYVLARRKAEWARFKMVRVGKRAEIILSESKKAEGKILNSTNPNVLFNVAAYCSDEWAAAQKEELLRTTLQDEVDRIVRQQSGPEPEAESEDYVGFMRERQEYVEAGVNPRNAKEVMTHLISMSNLELEADDACTIEMQGGDGNLPAALIEHILWPEFNYQIESVHCQSLDTGEWSAKVADLLTYRGMLGAIVNYEHPQVSNHYCAVIKFPNSSDPTKPYAIGDSILPAVTPPQSIINYYSLEEIMAQLLSLDPIHITCVFAQAATRADTKAVRRMVEAGEDILPEEDAAAAAAEEEAVAQANGGTQANGGSRKTRRASKARRNKSSRR